MRPLFLTTFFLGFLLNLGAQDSGLESLIQTITAHEEKIQAKIKAQKAEAHPPYETPEDFAQRQKTELAEAKTFTPQTFTLTGPIKTGKFDPKTKSWPLTLEIPGFLPPQTLSWPADPANLKASYEAGENLIAQGGITGALTLELSYPLGQWSLLPQKLEVNPKKGAPWEIYPPEISGTSKSIYGTPLSFSWEKRPFIEMVRVEGGTFMMGKTQTDPGIKTTASSFRIGRTEVTQKQWKEVMGTEPSEFKGPNLPVERVSWYDAVEFCNKLSKKEGLVPVYLVNGTNVTLLPKATGYRLPTEAQWEFAARGGNASQGSTYSGGNTAESQGWIVTNSGDTTKPVGTRGANELGIYDMTGNVWEWCWDWWGEPSGGKDPVGPSSGMSRVNRGGSWFFSNDWATVYSRYSNAPTNQHFYLGFRVVRP